MDKALGEAERLCTEISFNVNIQDILSYYTPLDNQDYYNISRTMKNLAAYKNTYSSVEDFYIYFKKIDIALSPNGASDEKTFYEAYYKEIGLPYDKWHTINETPYNGNYIVVNGKEDNKKIVLYARSLPILENNFIKATVFVRLNESKFIEKVNQLKDINGVAAFIVDKDNTIISSTCDITFEEKIDYSEVPKNSGSFHKSINGKNMIVSYTTSENNSWKYIAITPSRVFWSDVQYVKKYAVISILLCLLIGGIVAVIMANRNYNPVRRLVNKFDKQAISAGNRKQNEYLFIEDALTGIITRESQMEKKLEQQNEALRSDFLARLFKGDFKETSYIKEYISSLNFSFITDYFAVFLVYIEDVEEGNFQSRVNLTKDILKEVLSETFKVYMTEVDGITTCIINLKYEPQNTEIYEIVSVIRKVQDIANMNYKVQLSFSISTIHKGIERIEKAFYEAVQAMEYKKIMGIEAILCFSDMSKYSGAKLNYSLNKDDHLINFIKTGDLVNCKRLLAEIFEDETNNRYLCQITNKAFKMNLVSMLISIINEITVSQDKYFNLLCMTEQLIKLNSVNEFKEKMIEIIIAINDTPLKDSDNNLKLKDKIIKYIDKNSSNPDINITSIADYLNMHPVYISQVFREQTGEGILDYIHKTRIKIAKTLLKKAEYTLDMVSKEAGYSNTRTFLRAFKKYEGINPGCYKDNRLI
jgi:AraC-like DNA-binding protein